MTGALAGSERQGQSWEQPQGEILKSRWSGGTNIEATGMK